jgi:hypothetical protein
MNWLHLVAAGITIWDRLIQLPQEGLEPPTGGLEIRRLDAGNAANHGVSENPPHVVARMVARLPNDPDLERIAAAWSHLPAHIKAAMLALVQTASGGD